jgi:hypothetical protein
MRFYLRPMPCLVGLSAWCVHVAKTPYSFTNFTSVRCVLKNKQDGFWIRTQRFVDWILFTKRCFEK